MKIPSTAGYPRMLGIGSKPIREVVDKFMDKADADKSGSIDLDSEAKQGVDKLRPADRNRDGGVSRTELTAFLKRFDTDQDGKLGKRELQPLRGK